MTVEEYVTSWDALTPWQQEQAIENYAAIREAEEETPCSLNRAAHDAPACRGWWIDRYGIVTCNI